MVILITGATGYIGSHVTKEALNRGHRVRVTERVEGRATFLKSLPGAEEGLEVITMDLLDPTSISAGLQGVEAIIHTAALLPLDGVTGEEVVEASLAGTRNLLQAIDTHAPDLGRFIHTSSVAAIVGYGGPRRSSYGPEDWCEDGAEDNPYGHAKAQAERILRSWWEAKPSDRRPHLCTIHPVTVLGPVMTERHLRTSTPTAVDHIVRGRPRVLIPMQFDVVDVRDVARLHLDAMDTGVPGERYIACTSSISLGYMARASDPVLREAGRRAPRWTLPRFLSLVVLRWLRGLSNKEAKRRLSTDRHVFDRSLTDARFDIDWTDMEVSVADTTRSILHLID